MTPRQMHFKSLKVILTSPVIKQRWLCKKPCLPCRKNNSDNVAQYELIPWILSQCSSTAEAKEKVETLCLLGTPFHEKMPAAQLHWLIADKHQAITVEATAAGIQVYDNPAGVLTNNPPFP